MNDFLLVCFVFTVCGLCFFAEGVFFPEPESEILQELRIEATRKRRGTNLTPPSNYKKYKKWCKRFPDAQPFNFTR